MTHKFFKDILANPDLLPFVREDITSLPSAYNPTGKIKAILLGADPTNDGVPCNRGLKVLDKVFDLDGPYEKQFFSPHKINLGAIGLSKEDVFVQNLCRSYFTLQTTENQTQWYASASLWIKYLKEELDSIPSTVPVLASCNEVFTFLTDRKGPFTDIYNLDTNPVFHSEKLDRHVLALFRGQSYILHPNRWNDYKTHLKNYFING